MKDSTGFFGMFGNKIRVFWTTRSLLAEPENVDAKTIRLRQREHMYVHIEDIAHVESSVDDDEKDGTWIYLRHQSERRECLEPAKKVREMIVEAKGKERVQLDAIAISLLLKAARKLSDGRLQFADDNDGLTVSAGGTTTGPLQGRDRSEYKHAEEQITGHALVEVESNGSYRLSLRGYHMAEFLVANQHPDDLPFLGFVKLPASFSGAPPHIGVQVNQTNNNTGDVDNAISEKGNLAQTIKKLDLNLLRRVPVIIIDVVGSPCKEPPRWTKKLSTRP